MSKARANLASRLAAYRSAARAELLVSRAPTETEHNARAQILRNGLAVSGFAMLEEFLKSRTAEVLQRIGAGRTAFSNLPSAVRDAATAGVVRALKFQDAFQDRRSSDYHRFYQDHARAIYSTGTAAYEISTLAFANEASNISSDTVQGILDAFRVDNSWSAIGSIASRCNVGVLDLRSAMTAAAARRHAAAHQADAAVEIADLQAFAVEVVGISLGFDLLLSRALRKILDADRDYLSQQRKVAARDVPIRVLEQDGGWWREVVLPNTRAFKRNRDRDTLLAGCTTRARAKGESVVVLGARGFPMEWATPDVD